MTTLVKIQRKGTVTLPRNVRTAIGVAEGDLVEASVQRGKIVLTPKPALDISKFPTADDEYTPEQRRVLDARLAEGLADMKAGRTFGPFNSADEMITHMKKRLKKRATDRKAKRAS